VRIRERIICGSDAGSAVTAVLQRTGRPASFSSYVLIVGFATMMLSSLVALQEMGLVAAFTMAYVLLSDLVLAPAIFLLLAQRDIRRMAPLRADGIAVRVLQAAAAR
jgi:predicted RND superfamily exporter protein